jgi:hypothetical protein
VEVEVVNVTASPTSRIKYCSKYWKMEVQVVEEVMLEVVQELLIQLIQIHQGGAGNTPPVSPPQGKSWWKWI